MSKTKEKLVIKTAVFDTLTSKAGSYMGVNNSESGGGGQNRP